jgi:O-antigen/teichoic acid export membrane protein
MSRLFSLLLNRNTLVITDQAIFSGSSFLATFLTARLLSMTEFGLYAGFILVLYLLISVSNALVVQPFQVSYSRIRQKTKYLSFVFWFQLVVLLTVVLIVILMAALTHPDLKSHLPEAVMSGVGFILHDFLRKIFLAKDRVEKALRIDAVTAFSQIALLGLSFCSGHLTLSQALYFSGLSYLMGVALGIYFLKPGLTSINESRIFFNDHLQQGRWLFLTAVVQWWSGNLFIVAAGVFLGPMALGAFRLVQSLFGILNVLLQTYENYALPQAVRIFETSVTASKKYLQNISMKGVLFFGGVLLLLFIFSRQVICLAGGTKYASYHYVIRGMTLLYFIIFVGYPARMAVRMMLLNHIFFLGYVLSFGTGLLSFHFLLKEYQLWGAIAGLIINQLVLISFWQYYLAKKHFLLWR